MLSVNFSVNMVLFQQVVIRTVTHKTRWRLCDADCWATRLQ